MAGGGAGKCSSFTGINVQADSCSTLIYREQSTITKLQWLKLDPYR